MKTTQGTGASSHGEQSCSLVQTVTLPLTLCSVGSLLQKVHFIKSKEGYFLPGTLFPNVVKHFRYSDKLNWTVSICRDMSILDALAERQANRVS